ncbi:MAG: preprotein translocase subunit YajC [Clostridiales bacterium]|nr:preprotein translocase subunit YajC [Clostridiales bacterium]
MFFYNLLTDTTSSSGNTGSGYQTWVLLGVAVLMIGLMMFFNHRSQKKRQKEMDDTLAAIKPGCKVKTIGGICGVVVEVNNDENTFVLETGSKKNKSYIKFDKIAVYQTDAKKEEAPAPVEVAEPVAEEVVEAPVEAVEETKDAE